LYFERIAFDIRELEDEDKCLVGLRLPPYKPREICWAVVDKRTWIQGCIDAACEAMPMLPKSRLALVKVSKTVNRSLFNLLLTCKKLLIASRLGRDSMGYFKSTSSISTYQSS
jgi:hypothetical protein